MDGAEVQLLTPRVRRAVALIALAVTAIVTASLVYLHPATAPRPTSAPRSSLPPGFTNTSDQITYDFVTPSSGWALVISTAPIPSTGQFWVYRTVDGAKHWRSELSGPASYSGLSSLAIKFLDPTHGFVAVGAPNQIYRTVDGGAHWAPISIPAAALFQVSFSDSRHGWLVTTATNKPVGPLNLYSTSDAGTTWQQLPDLPADTASVGFRNQSEAWIGAGGPSLPPHAFTSVDGGRTWQRHDLSEPPGGLPPDVLAGVDVRLLPGAGVEALVYFQNGSQYGFTSFDEGSSWRYVPALPTANASGGGVSYQDAFHWWRLDGGTLFKSADAGQTWTSVATQVLDGGYFPEIIDSSHAWSEVFLTHGTGLALTADGGRHWKRVPVPLPD